MANKKTKKTRLKKLKLAPKSRWLNKWSLIAVVLAVAAVGGLMLYKILAATISTQDEKIQYNDIISTRTSKGLPAQKAATCLTKRARSWSKNMASVGHIYHSASFADELNKACGTHFTWAAENVGVVSCTSATDYSCDDNLYKAFTSDKEKHDCIYGIDLANHYCNITNTLGRYIGVGAYRDDKNLLWVTHEFYNCSCTLATYTPLTWSLRGVASASSSSSPRASSATARRGESYTLYNDVVNDGPDTATFRKYIHFYHYNSAGTQLSGSTKNDSTISLGNDGVALYKITGIIPSTAAIGEKYCSTIFFENKTGPLTSGGHSNKTCVTVVS